MLQAEVEDIILRDRRRGSFVYPYYEKLCSSNIVPTVLDTFGISTDRPRLDDSVYRDRVDTEDISKMVLFLFDGLGYAQWQNDYRNHDFLGRFVDRGTVSPITSVFPSTTAAALTTVGTGLTPQEHCLPEWSVYLKEIDEIIQTLPFSRYGSDLRDELLYRGVDPKILFKGKTIHKTLGENGVKSFTLVNHNYSNSAYSSLAYEGSEVVPCLNLWDTFIELKSRLEDEEGPSYFYVYISDVDSAEHKYGPYSPEYHSALRNISDCFKGELIDKIGRKTAQETLVAITADHGQINVNPERTIYLNGERDLEGDFQTSVGGRTIFPTGSPRDMFMHIEPSRLDYVQEFLSQKLEDKAKVVRIEDAVREGLFGIGTPEEKFLDRVGNLLVLPYGNNTIWYEHLPGKIFKSLGFHGGLNRDEVLIPFAVSRLSSLL